MSSEISEGLGLGTPLPSEILEGNFVLKCYNRHTLVQHTYFFSSVCNQ